MKKAIKILMAQINTTVGDFVGNSRKVGVVLDEARAQRASLVVFPEMTITGYPPEDLLLQKKFIDENIKTLKIISKKTSGLSVIIGFVDRDASGILYNSAAVLSNGNVEVIYHKTKLPNYGVFDEKRYFKAGIRPRIIRVGGNRVGLSICEDIWRKDSFVYSKSFPSKIDLLVNISASPYHTGKLGERRKLIGDLSRKIGKPVVYVNLVGGQDELVFDGGSLVANQGKIVTQMEQFKEGLRIADLSNTRISSGPANTPVLEDEVLQALILGTRDYVLKNGFKKVVIGLSGGIDSALVAAIAVRAIGAENVLGVTMPSKITSNETYQDAKKLAKKLNIRCEEFGIAPIFEIYRETLKSSFKNLPMDATEENLQARVRGNLLMALSNKFGYLVLTTGNKSEMATGYCTLYGDMAGGFAVIKDVPKTLVFRLCRFLNKQAGYELIPNSIIKRPPTAELRPNQKDQDSLPPYPVLDAFLEKYVENDVLPSASSKKLLKLVVRNEYKRRQAPPGVKITPKAFGRDRRMPITTAFPSL